MLKCIVPAAVSMVSNLPAHITHLVRKLIAASGASMASAAEKDTVRRLAPEVSRVIEVEIMGRSGGNVQVRDFLNAMCDAVDR